MYTSRSGTEEINIRRWRRAGWVPIGELDNSRFGTDRPKTRNNAER